jgi:hypothetical protein
VSGTVVLSGASNSYYEIVVEYKTAGPAYGCTLSWQAPTYSKRVVSVVSLYYVRRAVPENIMDLRVFPGMLLYSSFALFV